MSTQTAIEWADATINPWWGCTEVSPACNRCYAKTWDNRWSGTSGGHWGRKAPRRLIKGWYRDAHALNNRAQREGRPLRVFCASMADVFEEPRPLVDHHNTPAWYAPGTDTVHCAPGTPGTLQNPGAPGPAWDRLTTEHLRRRLWNVVADTPHLIWMLLTKRPENVRAMVPLTWLADWPNNVWLGATTENQTYFDRRIAPLLDVPAKVRFLSCEPLLGPIAFSDVTGRSDAVKRLGKPALDGIHWVIAGGESGLPGDPGVRPTHPDWLRSLRDQCAAPGNETPFFFKQWGEWLTLTVRGKNCPPARVGKQQAGRTLDGQTHNALPSLIQETAA